MSSNVSSHLSLNYYYYDIWQMYHDPRSSSWPFFDGGPWSTLAIIGGYLYFVKIMGPELMKGRPPFDLKRIIFIYNLAMVMVSTWMFIEACLLLNWGLDTWGCQPVNHFSNSPIEQRKLFLGFTFFITKFIELADTIFFVLRKKFNQLSALHIIHHTLVPALVWLGFKFLPGGSNAFFVYINSLVHIIMYTYYGLSILGPKIQPYLWWKKYLTKLQIVQFVLIIINSVRLLFMPNCPAPKAFTYMTILNAGLFLMLFASFYRQSYRSLMKKASATCACSGCFITIGVFILVAGGVIRSVSSINKSPFYDDPYYHRPHEDLSRTPILISTILMSVGGGFIAFSLLLMILALVAYKRSQKIRHRTIVSSVNPLHQDESTSTEEASSSSTPEYIPNHTDYRPHGDINTIGLPNGLPHIIGFSYTSGCLPGNYQFMKNSPYYSYIQKESNI